MWTKKSVARTQSGICSSRKTNNAVASRLRFAFAIGIFWLALLASPNLSSQQQPQMQVQQQPQHLQQMQQPQQFESSQQPQQSQQPLEQQQSQQLQQPQPQQQQQPPQLQSLHTQPQSQLTQVPQPSHSQQQQVRDQMQLQNQQLQQSQTQQSQIQLQPQTQSQPQTTQTQPQSQSQQPQPQQQPLHEQQTQQPAQLQQVVQPVVQRQLQLQPMQQTLHQTIGSAQTIPLQSPTILSTTEQHLQPQLVQQQQQSQQHQHQQQLQNQQHIQIQQQQQQMQQISAINTFKYQPSVLSPLYLGHNPFIEVLRPLSYADDNIVTLNLSHSHIYEIDGDAFVGQRFEHIDLSNNKLGLIHSRSFRIGPNHSRHTPYDPRTNSSSLMMKLNSANPHQQHYPTRRPPPAHPKSVTIDFSHNPAIVALSGAFDHIDVPNCLLNFTNSTVELKFGAFKKYFKEHPGHIIDIDTVDCCDQEWLLGYKHNFVARTHCAHDPNLYLLKVSQQTIIDSCIAYVTSARHSMTMPGTGIILSAAANAPRHSSEANRDNQQYLTYLILGGTAMILTSLSIYIIFYMFSLKAAFVYQMQTQKN